MAAAVTAAAFVFALASLPDRRIDMPAPSGPGAWPLTAAGAFHVHTNRSDGSGTPDEVAAAAARAGLAFIVLTDHGDGTRRPDPPRYRSGVLVIDAVEISTSTGHYIAIGLPQTPYPLGGEARDVVEDVRRFGGFGIAAHPDSVKTGLRWQEWDAPVDGLEWLNADSQWRDERVWRLGRALFQYPLRPAETLASFLDRPEQLMSRWDELTRSRQVVSIAGADAHARAGWWDDDANGYHRGWFARIPSYDVSFRAFAIRVNLPRPLPDDANAAASDVVAAIRAGHLFSAIDAIASPPAFEFSAVSADASARQGDILETKAPAVFDVRVNADAEGTIVLRKDGRVAAEHATPALRFQSDGAGGVYRVEVYLSKSPGQPRVPWIVSNPIYVGLSGFNTTAPAAPPAASDTWPVQGGPWHVENDVRSTATFAAATLPGPVSLAYQLGGGARTGQYAALVLSAGNALRGHNRLTFTAQASQPMRLSIQARLPGTGDRWQRSIFVDRQAREFVVMFADMKPVGATSSPGFDPARIDSVMFVADTTNALPGSEASFTVSATRVEH